MALSEKEAFDQAVGWVKDEIMKTGVSEFESSCLAEGFINGFLLGLRKGMLGSLIDQDSTAEAFFRGNWRAANDYLEAL